MLTTLTLALMLATPTAGPLNHADFSDQSTIDAARQIARDGLAELEADAILADSVQQRILLSAMLCEAKQRVTDTEAALSRGLTKPLARAALRASRDVDSARLRLAVLGMRPLSCGTSDVDLVAQCLGPVAPASCESDDHMAAVTAAAERLAVQP